MEGKTFSLVCMLMSGLAGGFAYFVASNSNSGIAAFAFIAISIGFGLISLASYVEAQADRIVKELRNNKN